MALRKQVVDIPLNGGINTKTTAKGLTPPDFLTLKNVRFKKAGALQKRFGYTNLGQAINTGTLNTPTSLDTLNNELLMFSTDKLYSRSVSDSTWYDKGSITTTSTDLEKITASPVDSSAVEVSVLDNIKVASWLEGTTIYYSVVDLSTESTIIEKATLVTSAGSIYPRMSAQGDYIYIFWNATNDLAYAQIPIANPSSVTTGTVSGVDMDSAGIFDIATDNGSGHFVFYKENGTSDMLIARLDDDLVIIATNTISSDVGTSYKNTVVSVYNSTLLGTVVALGWVDSSNNIRHTAYDIGLVAHYAPATVETLANVDSMIISVEATTGDTAKYIYSVSNADDSKYYTKGSVVNTQTGSAATAAIFLRSVGLVSKPILYNNISYFNVLHDSPLQATYFTVTNSGQVVAKFAAGEAGTHDTTKRLSNFIGNVTATNSSPDSFIFGALKKGRVRSENAILFADRSPHFATLKIKPSEAFQTSEVNNNLIISGGVVLSYDGQSTTEYGFHLYPEDVSLAQTTSGSIANGTYLVYAVYEWVDKQGVRHQSAPSVGQSITTTGSNQTITVTVPTLRITSKDTNAPTPRAKTKIKVYITEDGGTVPYLASTQDNSDILVDDSIDVSLTTDPSGLTSNAILYTSGGEVENIAAGSCRSLFTHDNRIITVGLENPNQIRFSKQIRPGEGSGFNEDFSIDVDPLGGDIVTGASMDDYMIIFKESAIYAISGSGPNDLGQNSNYSSPQLISSDIGCKDIKSVLQMPDGIVVKSEKGIYLLTRGLELIYFGAKVEDYNDNTILSAKLLKHANEIRFATDADLTLVYNYFFKQWSVFTTAGILDSTTWQNTEYVYLTLSKVMQEDSTTYLDDGSYVSTTIRTGWIHLAGIQGFQRIYKMAMLGTYHTDHTFQIKHYYDYSDTVIDTINVSAGTLVNTALYGDSATYGADSFYGGSDSNEVFQMRSDSPRQLCESISYEFHDAISGTNSGQGFDITGLSLLVGSKSGLHRSSSTRKV